MYDKTKTAELLKNLGDEETVEVKDLSKILSKKVVGVRLNGRRGKMATTVGIKDLGLNDYDKIDDFVQSKMNKTVINFFDKSIIAKFENVINKVRQLMYNSASSSDGVIYYMTEKNFLDFKKSFDEKYKIEYDKLKDVLISELPAHKASFQSDLKTFVESRGIDETEAQVLYKSILSKFPTEEQIRNDCNIDYYVIAFPVFDEKNISGINSIVADKIRTDKDNSAVEVFYDMVGNNIKDAFEVVYKCLDCIDDTPSLQGKTMEFTPPSKTRGFINCKILKLIDDNKVLKNDTLGKAIKITSRTFREYLDKDGNAVTNKQAQETSEQLLGILYNYAKYLGLEEKILPIINTTDYSEDDLSIIGDVANIDEL